MIWKIYISIVTTLPKNVYVICIIQRICLSKYGLEREAVIYTVTKYNYSQGSIGNQFLNYFILNLNITSMTTL